MTVKELKEILEKCDDSRLVILASDPEGNEYRELYETVVNNTTYDVQCNELGLEYLTEELRADGFEDDDIDLEAPRAIVLYP